MTPYAIKNVRLLAMLLIGITAAVILSPCRTSVAWANPPVPVGTLGDDVVSDVAPISRETLVLSERDLPDISPQELSGRRVLLEALSESIELVKIFKEDTTTEVSTGRLEVDNGPGTGRTFVETAYERGGIIYRQNGQIKINAFDLQERGIPKDLYVGRAQVLTDQGAEIVATFHTHPPANTVLLGYNYGFRGIPRPTSETIFFGPSSEDISTFNWTPQMGPVHFIAQREGSGWFGDGAVSVSILYRFKDEWDQSLVGSGIVDARWLVRER